MKEGPHDLLPNAHGLCRQALRSFHSLARVIELRREHQDEKHIRGQRDDS